LTEDIFAAAGHDTSLTGPVYDYLLYGLRLRSSLKLTLDDVPVEGDADLKLLLATPDWFESAVSAVKLDASNWIHIHELPGGWSYIRYDENFDFLISPSGNCILYRLLAQVPFESFQTYALGRVFSFALVKMSYEPLHAAAIVVEGRAIAFLGASAFGKSSLAACFVAGNFPLVTDDVLSWREENGSCLVFPGPPRLKLYPEVASLFLGRRVEGVPMDARSAKSVFLLSGFQSYSASVPLAVIYIVTAPWEIHCADGIQIRPNSPKDALLKVLGFTLHHQLAGKDRIERQFSAARKIIECVPVRRLDYPRDISLLPKVRDAILADLRNG
jgi:hypothetical protein